MTLEDAVLNGELRFCPFLEGFSIHAFAFEKSYVQSELTAVRFLGMCVTLALVGVFSSRKFTQNTLGKDRVPCT